ncbi:MAG: hypothetical protein DWQ07_13340 [Chloroflexi bacterium]|nr:MAG: hypothetical protein DWQ07_13340 [Chloroflexota bacterium]MBL1196780.1 hypothetical protein [Chloroflexota bacterium]NOH14074.1 hypothetical protein [Chloroflexota bacterium]
MYSHTKIKSDQFVKLGKKFTVFLLLLIMSACAAPNAVEVAVEPNETSAIEIAEAEETAIPSSTPIPNPDQPTPVINTARPENTPTITPTAVLLVDPNIEIPTAHIRIHRPGPGSKVSSGFFLIIDFIPTGDNKVRIELFGEDGRSISAFNHRYIARLNQERVELAFAIDYEIQAFSELGRIQVSLDDEFGRPQALTSVDLILLSAGSSSINPPQDEREKIYIQQPFKDTIVPGGSLALTGIVRTDNANPLVVELTTEEGKVVGTALAGVAVEPGQAYGLFAGEVEYEVDEPTWVRMTIRELDRRIPGVRYVSSLLFVVAP